MASDGGASVRASGSKARASGFQWISPAPSTEEVKRLELAYPEVIQLEEEALEAERAGWQSTAILARSFNRWVPAEAFVREFRRAGIQGEINPISLAFRCHIFRFADVNACESVLNRPWVINGQVIGMEPWKPDFIPAAEAISSALVWVRLPSLPMEFWKEEFLRKITESAGEFVRVDPPTLAKSRGGFARVCIRMDLRRPLRPGTRIQGVRQPFWQQFAFESLEGICSSCGSLHLEGPCSNPPDAVEKETEQRLRFGPWITALRQRREVPTGLREEKRKPGGWTVMGSEDGGASSSKPQTERRQGAVDDDG